MSKAKWTAIKSSDIEVDTRVGPHKWNRFKSRFLPWEYCQYCGLIALHNPITLKLILHSCPPWDYYNRVLRRRGEVV